MYIAITPKEGIRTLELVKRIKIIDRLNYEVLTMMDETLFIHIEHATLEDRDLVNVKKYNEEIVDKEVAYLMSFFMGQVRTLDLYQRDDGTFYFVP